MNRLFSKLLAISLLLVCSAVFAQPSPLIMLEEVSDKLIAELKRREAAIDRNPDIVYDLVNRLLLPHVDTLAMSRSALGRDAWLKATPAQRIAFEKEFTKTVVRTYGSALAVYTNERIVFSPMRGGYKGKKRVQVVSRIIKNGGPPIPVSYKLVLRSNNQWKVYDMSVEGISLLQSFRSQFASELSQYGLSKVITRLKEHNRATK